MRILRRLFDPDEAGLAQLLTVKPESVEAIAARASLDADDLGPKLESMAKKGLIFRYRKGDKVRYMAAQFVVGIWEYHVNDLDPDLIRDMNEYLPYFFDQSIKVKTPQLRTIPISRAVPVEQKIMAYERAREIVLGAGGDRGGALHLPKGTAIVVRAATGLWRAAWYSALGPSTTLKMGSRARSIMMKHCAFWTRQRKKGSCCSPPTLRKRSTSAPAVVAAAKF